MSRKQSVKRGVAVVSSGALVVGAGAAVGVLAADMSAQWSQKAALEAAAQVVEDPADDLPVPRPVVVTLTEEHHITPKPVKVHRKVYVRVSSGQGSTHRSQPTRARTSKRKTGSAPAARPSRRVVAPAPAKPRASTGSKPKAKSKTS